MKLWVRVKTEEQFLSALEYNLNAKESEQVQIACFIVDHFCALSGRVISGIKKTRSENRNIKFYYQFPDIYREKNHAKPHIDANLVDMFDGVVIKNLDELGLVVKEKYPKGVIADSFLYAMNREAMGFYRELMPGIKFISNDELTNEELNLLIESQGTESDFIIKAYGHQIVMITAQCMNKNYRHCLKENGKPDKNKSCITFTDEFNDGLIAFSNCNECYSVIYQETPTCIISKVWEKYENILLDFTVESAKETAGILEKRTVEDYSLGHYKQGID